MNNGLFQPPGQPMGPPPGQPMGPPPGQPMGPPPGQPMRQQYVPPPEYKYSVGNPIIDKYIHAFIGSL